MKLAFWPSVIWLLVEYFPLKNHTKNFFTAKTVGTYFMVMLIPIVFYLYTSVSGKSIFDIDITTFIVAVISGQIISYRFLGEKKLPKPIAKIACYVGCFDNCFHSLRVLSAPSNYFPRFIQQWVWNYWVIRNFNNNSAVLKKARYYTLKNP